MIRPPIDWFRRGQLPLSALDDRIRELHRLIMVEKETQRNIATSGMRVNRISHLKEDEEELAALLQVRQELTGDAGFPAEPPLAESYRRSSGYDPMQPVWPGFLIMVALAAGIAAAVYFMFLR